MRVHSDSIDYSALEIQKGEDYIQNFSFLNEGKHPNNEKDCYLAYTNQSTHDIIRNNLTKFPMYSGEIIGVGPRYCPSIETKVIRFSDKERHQLFIEPEALNTKEMYIQGFSTSAPVEIQEEMLHSLKGFENAKIMRDAYAIEYDCINSLELLPTLEHKKISGLYFAGQVNGTSGYEEAGAQGLLAGINASLKLRNLEPLILKRSEAYIGVLIDDLVTKGTNEPYRMMTSRAEYRLILRQDNADLRLTEIGRKVGLVTDERYEKYLNKKTQIENLIKELNIALKPEVLNPYLLSINENPIEFSTSIYNLIKRNNVDLKSIINYFDIFKNYPQSVVDEVNTMIKYEGYIKKQNEQIESMKKQEDLKLSTSFDYEKIQGLRLEARQKLNEIKPLNIGQASRISGISPADINVLIVYFKANPQKTL